MNISCQRSDFLSALQVVTRATAARSAVQILSGVAMRAEHDQLVCAATDMSISLRCSLAAEAHQEGAAVVPGRLLLEIARALPTEQVHLQRHEDAGVLRIACGATAFELDTFSFDDFPQLPTIDNDRVRELPARPFLDALGHAGSAASRDEARPVLTGILVRLESGNVITVGTDAYRMSYKRAQLALDIGDEALEAIIPARVREELSRLVQPANVDTIGFYITANQVIFRVGEAWMTARRIDGQFPSYEQFQPQTLPFESEAIVARDEFLEVVRRVSLVALRNAPIRLRFERGQVTVSAQTQDVGGAQEVLPIRYDGEPLEVGLRPDWLRAGVESVTDERLRLRIINSLRPVFLSGPTDDEWHLIMPVRLAA